VASLRQEKQTCLGGGNELGLQVATVENLSPLSNGFPQIATKRESTSSRE